MPKCCKAIWYILLLLCSVASRAQQQPRHYQYRSANGLQSNTVYNVHRARNGLVYIAHELGLSSFDGQNFINYPNLHQPNCELTNIVEANNGRIFCKSFTNNLYELRGQQLHFVGHFPTGIGYQPVGAYQQYVMNVTNDTLALWNTTTNIAVCRKLQYRQGPTTGNVVYAAGYSRNQSYYTILVNDKLEVSYVDSGMYPMYVWHSGNGEAFGTRGKSVRDIIRLSTGETLNTNAAEDAAVNFVSCSESYIWICTNNGVYYRPRKGKGLPMQHILAGYNTTAVAEVSGMGAVVSTLGNGILYIPCFDVVKYTGLPAPVTVINGTSSELLAGCSDGSLVTINKADATKKALQKEGTQPVSFIFSEEGRVLTERNGTLNGRTLIASLKDYCPVQGGYIFSSANGLYFYHSSNAHSWLRKFCSKTLTTNLYETVFPYGYTSRLCYDNTRHALYFIQNGTVHYIDSTLATSRPLQLPPCVLRDIGIYHNQLYIATKDKGLLVEQNGRFVPATLTGGSLAGSILYQISVWKDEMWLLGEDAISVVNGNKLQQFGRNIGINSSDIRSFYIDSTDVYLIEGGDVTRFPKNILLTQKEQPDFLLHSIYCDTLALQPGAKLQPEQNHIRIRYSLVSLGAGSNVNAAYSINGGKKMQLSPNSNLLELNYLEPGNYDIQFYTGSPVSYHPVAACSFRIVPHFYNTPAFWILLLLPAGGLYYWYIRKRMARMRTGYEQQQARMMLERELDKSLLTSIRAQMNPHFLFNALNTIQSYVYMNDKRSAGIYISKFSDLTRRILDHSSRDTISLAEELNALNLYLELEAMRFEGILEYHIDIDDRINVNEQTLPPMLLQPYVENAIKHGLFHRKKNRQLAIRFMHAPLCIRIEIEDNGIGRKKSEELNRQRMKSHQSFSMQANRKRLDILRQQQPGIQLTIVDLYTPLQEPAGTKVIIELPRTVR